MSTESTSPAIVVGVDGSPASTLAVEWAARDAEMRNVPLKVVHVFAPMVAPANGWADVAMPADYARWREDQAHQIVQQAHAVAVDAAAPGRAAHVTSEVRYAAIVPAMVELSQQAEMVVVGCRGQGGVASALLGSVSSGLAHHAHCPVAIIHDDEPLPPRSAQAPVLVGVDGSPTSELATEIAFDEASRRGAELVALHAWTDMGPLDFPSINWAPIEWSNIKDQEEESPSGTPLRMAGTLSRCGYAQGCGERPTSTSAARTRPRRSACGCGQPRSRWVPRHAARLGQPSGRQLGTDSGHHRPHAPKLLRPSRG
ncbi:Universal stress protein family [Mycobacterium liflandii 128FXT]|uniref:Universal stress protein family n=1 Tax=Mycobacterium liflandii (strain 128FXT) TaxID=459424 RepID=L7VI10_MYCL1|nr:Universal stress protein family [Mycobacterium liflandii 128FXT]